MTVFNRFAPPTMHPDDARRRMHDYCKADAEFTYAFARIRDFVTVLGAQHDMSPAEFSGADLVLMFDALTGFFSC